MKEVKINWDVWVQFIDEFKTESDRAAVLLGAAKLDSLLHQILDRRLLPSLSSSDELLEGESPLSTFSARINACYRLGLIAADFAKALHTIRRIRNAFAHELSGCSLTTGPQSDRLTSLVLPLRGLPLYHKFTEHFFGKNINNSVEFRSCLAMMAARLEGLLGHTTPIADKDAWPLILPSWSEELSAPDLPDSQAPTSV